MEFPNLDRGKFTSNGTILSTVTANGPSKLRQVTCHFSKAVTDTFKVTFDSSFGSDYDTLLISQALNGVCDILYQPDNDFNLEKDDAITVECANGVCATYGLIIGVAEESS